MSILRSSCAKVKWWTTKWKTLSESTCSMMVEMINLNKMEDSHFSAPLLALTSTTRTFWRESKSSSRKEKWLTGRSGWKMRIKRWLRSSRWWLQGRGRSTSKRKLKHKCKTSWRQRSMKATRTKRKTSLNILTRQCHKRTFIRLLQTTSKSMINWFQIIRIK